MGSLNKRANVLQQHVETQVRARMEAEIEALLDLLEKRLTPEEFRKVARVVLEAEDGDGA